MNLTEFRRGVTLAFKGTMRTSNPLMPKKSFSSKVSIPNLRSALDAAHQKIRQAASPAPMYDAVDDYVATAAQLAMALGAAGNTGIARGGSPVLTAAAVAAPFIPGGAVLSAAISSVGSLKSSSAGA